MCDRPLELFIDLDKHLFIENGIRGGVSTISKRFAKANNKYMEIYNPDKETSYIMYLDANNLYGWAMLQPLPFGGFKWKEKTEQINEQWILALKDNDPIGYIFEVDLKYPEQIHHLNNEYPLAPEKMKILKEMSSPYFPSSPQNDSVQKLIPN